MEFLSHQNFFYEDYYNVTVIIVWPHLLRSELVSESFEVFVVFAHPQQETAPTDLVGWIRIGLDRFAVVLFVFCFLIVRPLFEIF